MWRLIPGLLLAACTQAQPHDPALVAAVEQVESGGNPRAVGDSGKAVGILQIQPIMVRDVNRILGSQRYSLADRLDPVKSREMFWVYADHYSPGASREVIARRWNLGPKGDRSPATVGYWRKVSAALEEKP